MMDQAAKLREIVQHQNEKQARTIAVVSGKGGVGKSNISINTAMILTKKGFNVLLFDLDLGMGNVNIILGAPAPLTLYHFLYEGAQIKDIIYRTETGVSYISAGNGLNETIHLNENMLGNLLSGLQKLQTMYDFIIFDMAAGATSSTLKVLLSVDDIFVVTTPEPTAITDAYSMMKFICIEGSSSPFYLICNRADHDRQGVETLKRLQITANKFLKKDVILLGVLPEDHHVRKAVINQTAFSIQFPNSYISTKLEKLLSGFLNEEPSQIKYKGQFISKLKKLFSKQH